VKLTSSNTAGKVNPLFEGHLRDQSTSLYVGLLPVTRTLTPRAGILGRTPLETGGTLDGVRIFRLETRVCGVGERRSEVAKLSIYQRGSRRSKDI
jgi:hypothetical protein